MKLTFLGTAGGRWAMLRQTRATGGFVLQMDGEKIFIDPGPGALVRAIQYKVKLSNLTALIVTHDHVDHVNDAEVIIEAMTNGTKVKRGVLISNDTVLEGRDSRGIIDDFHRRPLERIVSMKAGDKCDLGKIEIVATKAEHSEVNTFGLIFKGSKTIGYTSDSQFFKGLGTQFQGCDILLINCLRPRKDGWPYHLNVDDTVKIINEAKPKKAILTHLGYDMIMRGPDKEARWVQEQTGVETIAATDRMVVRD